MTSSQTPLPGREPAAGDHTDAGLPGSVGAAGPTTPAGQGTDQVRGATHTTEKDHIPALDLGRLRELAWNATAGPWTAEAIGSEGYRVYGPQEQGITPRHRRRPVVAACSWEPWDRLRNDAEFIAACDPATLLTLLDRLERAEHALFSPGSPGPSHV